MSFAQKHIIMKYLFISVLFLCLSCGKEKSVQLPEIIHSNIHTIEDVSAAYIFYNENEAQRAELNRKNLIISTNWLVNVDKRLTLKEVIPLVQTLQDKKRNAQMHKNEAAKNYYSCNDNSIKNLGFIDFTETIYHNDIDKNIIESPNLYNLPPLDQTNHILSILFKANDSISINTSHTTKSEFVNRLKYMDSIQNKIVGLVYLKFHESLTFQQYITYKSILSEVKLQNATISNDEYIFN